MSDFFSNLIARNFTDQSAIRPRLPSLFESAATEPFAEQPPATPAMTAEQTSPPTIPARPKLFAAGKPVAEKPVPNAALDRVAVKPPLDANEPATPVHPATINPPRSDDGNAETRRVEPRAKKNIVPFTTSPDGKNQVHAAKTPLTQTPPERHAFQSRQNNSFPPVEPRPSAPVIQVTIGRVEVRAIQSAGPAPKPAKPAPPKLSLDDYLQKRDGGSR